MDLKEILWHIHGKHFIYLYLLLSLSRTFIEDASLIIYVSFGIQVAI